MTHVPPRAAVSFALLATLALAAVTAARADVVIDSNAKAADVVSRRGVRHFVMVFVIGRGAGAPKVPPKVSAPEVSNTCGGPEEETLRPEPSTVTDR